MSTTVSFLDLNNYQPLDTLTPDNLKEIAQKLEVIELNNADVVFEHGDKDEDYCHVFLYRGNVELIKASKTLKRSKRVRLKLRLH